MELELQRLKWNRRDEIRMKLKLNELWEKGWSKKWNEMKLSTKVRSMPCIWSYVWVLGFVACIAAVPFEGREFSPYKCLDIRRNN